MTTYADPVASPILQTLPPGMALQRKCACGDHHTGLGEERESCRETKTLGLQPKLRVGSSDDPLEHEADHVATQVLGNKRPAPLQPAPRQLSRYRSQPTGAQQVPASVTTTLALGGKPLPEQIRADFEPRFGHSFSKIRIHDGVQADVSARDVSARAYTVGHHLVFAAGQYAPATRPGRELLAHELAHAIQQSAAPSQPLLQRAPVPGGAGAPPVPSAPGSVPAHTPTLTPRKKVEMRAPKSDVCPSCMCNANHVARIDPARSKAADTLGSAASELQNRSAQVDRGFEAVFGDGAANEPNIMQARQRYEEAADFLTNSDITSGGSTQNIFCDQTSATTACASGAAGHYDRGNVILCTDNLATQQQLEPPTVDPIYKPQRVSASGTNQGSSARVLDHNATQDKQNESDAKFATRLTALLAHEAMHHVIRPNIVDVYREERLAGFLGGDAKGTGVDLSALALQNPDSFVRFAFLRYTSGGNSHRLPGADEATATSNALSGELHVRPLLGRKHAKLAVALAAEAITQMRERVDELNALVQSVQAGGTSQWSLFPVDTQSVVTALNTLGNETDLAQPNAAAAARLTILAQALGRLADNIQNQNIVLGRRFTQDRPKRMEIAIPDWKGFRASSSKQQMHLILDQLVATETDIAHLAPVIAHLAATDGGMGAL